MKSFSRADRVGATIQKNLSALLRKDIKDPRIHDAIISEVRMSPDIKNARIYFVVSGGKKARDAAEKGFEAASGYIRKHLAAMLGLRYMPTLKFVYDDSYDYGTHIDNILSSIATDHGEDRSAFEE